MEDQLVGQHLLAGVRSIADDLATAIDTCSQDRYALPLPLLSGATIGEHTRHIIEFFECLQQGLDQGKVDYAARSRNRQIETDKEYALRRLVAIVGSFKMEPRALDLVVQTGRGEPPLVVPSNFYRELVYNMEHAIHHMAIIKIGLKSLQLPVDENLGVASSTLQHRASCAS